MIVSKADYSLRANVAMTGTTKIGEDLRPPHWAQEDRARVFLFWEENEDLLLFLPFESRDSQCKGPEYNELLGRTFTSMS